jgi:hypothetical protein
MASDADVGAVVAYHPNGSGEEKKKRSAFVAIAVGIAFLVVVLAIVAALIVALGNHAAKNYDIKIQARNADGGIRSPWEIKRVVDEKMRAWLECRPYQTVFSGRIPVVSIDRVDSFRAFADRTVVPTLIKFDARGPPAKCTTVEDWWRSLEWERHYFSKDEMQHIWKGLLRDQWRNGRLLAYSLKQNGSANNDSATNGDEPQNDEEMESIIKDYYASRYSDAVLATYGRKDSTNTRYDIGVGGDAKSDVSVTVRSDYVGRRWLQTQPTLAPIFGMRRRPGDGPETSVFAANARLDLNDRVYVNPKIWFNAAGYSTSLHKDPVDNFSINMVGKKRWLLIPPEYEKEFYPRPFKEPTGVTRYDVANPYAADPKLFPNLFDKRIPYMELDVGPGDILYLPRGWLHYVNAIEDSFTITINLYASRPQLQQTKKIKKK